MEEKWDVGQTSINKNERDGKKISDVLFSLRKGGARVEMGPVLHLKRIRDESIGRIDHVRCC